MKKIILLAFAALFMSSCSYLSAKQERYLRSQNGPEITVPPSLSKENISHFYELPHQDQNAKIDITPPTSTA